MGLKLCLNGHAWAQRQLERRGIGCEALDNGFLSCAEPEKLQQICDSLGPEDIDRVLLPTADDRIMQAYRKLTPHCRFLVLLGDHNHVPDLRAS